jgi:para-aminobenzoate synthetase component 2
VQAERSAGRTQAPAVRVLVIDNYDSFVYNLIHYLTELGAQCVVRRNDAADVAVLDGMDGVLVSPGPGTPQRAGASMAVVRACAGRGVPLLGVCLGHQAIAAVYGGVVRRAPALLHGSTSSVYHHGAGVLAGLPSPFAAVRYHSLAVAEQTLPPAVEVTGRTAAGEVMALRHRELPIEGVQFHPEAVLSEHGHLLLANWLAGCGDPAAPERAADLDAPYAALRSAAFTG